MLAFLNGEDKKVPTSCLSFWCDKLTKARPGRRRIIVDFDELSNTEYTKSRVGLLFSLLHYAEGSLARLTLTYLIPLRMLHGLLPSKALLTLHPRLELLFSPFISAIKSGDVREYDERLEWAQPRLVGMSSYLVVERAREGCLRMLFKKA